MMPFQGLVYDVYTLYWVRCGCDRTTKVTLYTAMHKMQFVRVRSD